MILQLCSSVGDCHLGLLIFEMGKLKKRNRQLLLSEAANICTLFKEAMTIPISEEDLAVCLLFHC